MKTLSKPRRWTGAGLALILGLSLGCNNATHDSTKVNEAEHTHAMCDVNHKTKGSAPLTSVACDAKCSPSCTPCPSNTVVCDPKYNLTIPSVQLPAVQPNAMRAQNPPPYPLPMAVLPPVSNERYVIPEKPQVKSLDSLPDAQIVTSQKPSPESQQAFPPIGSPKEGTTPRRSYADITARPEFAHAAHYEWLVGELHYSPQKQQWRLRYAAIDEEDRYGGSVTLDANHMMDSFKDGQLARVEGCLQAPDSREPSPAYRVKSIEAMITYSK